MSQITCNCGNTNDSGFKFCPECAAPNPEYAKKQTIESQSPRPAKKKFTKVGESSLNKSSSEKSIVADKTVAPAAAAPIQKAAAPKKSYTIMRQTPVIPAKTIQAKPVPQPEDLYEEYEDDVEDTPVSQSDDSYEDYDYEDEETPVAGTSASYYGESEDYEDEDEYEEEEVEEVPVATAPSPLPFKNKGKVLAAPTTKSIRNVAKKTVTAMPKTKQVTQTKSSLGKNKPDYDPNHDGYYGDRLPAILDEVTKTSHMDVILKICLSAVCIAALITYCIFYVQV